MTVPGWVKDAIFYQIFPDRFANGDVSNDPENVREWGSTPTTWGFQGGDLQGIINKFDYLLDLGINAVYLNPIFLSASNHRYDTIDYFTIDKKLGDPATFQSLINKAHQNNIKIILDGVFNHTGRGFYAFIDNLENGANSAYRNWYHINHYPIDAFSPGKAKDYEAWWSFKNLPKLNTNHQPVRQYIFSVAKYWIDQGIDGWRLDVPNEIDDDAFWAEFRDTVKSANREAYLVGEIWEKDARWVNDQHFDGLMNYPLRTMILDFLNGKTVASKVIQTIEEQFSIYPEENVFSMFNVLGSHDTERIRTVLSNDVDLVKMAYLIQLTLPGAPVIYYGDEIGLTGSRDPDCRKAFPWEKERWDISLLNWVEKLIQFRRVFPELRNGQFLDLMPGDKKKILAYARKGQQRKFVIVVNNLKSFQSVDLPVKALDVKPGQRLNNLIGEESFIVSGSGQMVNINIPSKTAYLLIVS